MIVDCHTQIWESAGQLGRGAQQPVAEVELATAARHMEALVPVVDRSIVLAFKSRYLQAEIPNAFVADYVRRNPTKIVGFAGVDPNDRDCLEELRIAQEEMHLKGVTVSPGLQNFHPTDTRAMRLYEECVRRGMPVLFEFDPRNSAAKMEFARPLLLDEVAREIPELRIVIAHLGEPWIQETVALLGKHRHVYANVAGLLRQPWLAYNALMAAYEFGVIDKLLFGSGFPHRSPAASIEALYSINQFTKGTSLSAIPREMLRGIVERDSLKILGIERGQTAIAPRSKNVVFTDDE